MRGLGELHDRGQGRLEPLLEHAARCRVHAVGMPRSGRQHRAAAKVASTNVIDSGDSCGV